MKRFLYVLLCTVLAGCDYIEYHPYQTSVTGKTGINTSNCKKITAACDGKSSIRFVFITDTQRQYDQTWDAVKAINGRDDIDFVIHGGDLSDFGLRKEFCLMRDILEGLKVPYVSVIGNHDCLGTGEDVFKTIFGPTDFCFTAADTRFICLNTNALEYDYSKRIPDMDFIERCLADTSCNAVHTVPVMHIRPGAEEFNNNISALFQQQIRKFPGVEFCLFGHEHKMLESDLFGDGIIYYGCSNIADRAYLLFTVDQTGYECEKVYF